MLQFPLSEMALKNHNKCDRQTDGQNTNCHARHVKGLQRGLQQHRAVESDVDYILNIIIIIIITTTTITSRKHRNLRTAFHSSSLYIHV